MLSKAAINALKGLPACSNLISALVTGLKAHCVILLHLRSDLVFHQLIFSELLRACPCKNRPLKFWWKIDCFNFFYTSQAIYAMNENSLYFARLAFFIFSRFFFVGKLRTTQNQKLKPHILVFMRCLLKTRTFFRITR